MTLKNTFLLNIIIILFSSGCQPLPKIVASPVPTQPLQATVTTQPLAQAITLEPIIVSSPQVSETVLRKVPIPTSPTPAPEVQLIPSASATKSPLAETPATVAATAQAVQNEKQPATATPVQSQRNPINSAPLPTVVAIAAQDLTIVDTLADGLKIVYAEINGPLGRTKVWISHVNQLENRTLLTEITHKERYGPGGQISPHGNQLLYTMTPVDFSDRAAREVGSEVWIFDIEKRTSIKIAEAVNGFVQWIPSGEAIVYSRFKQDEGGEGFVTRLYTVALNDLQENQIFSINKFFSPQGFLNNQTLLYLENKNEVVTEVRTLNLQSGETELLQEVHIPQPWIESNISPDGTKLLVTTITPNIANKNYELFSISLVTGEQATILTYPYEEDVKGNHPRYHFNTKWLPNSQDILVQLPAQIDQSAHLTIIDVDHRKLPYPLISDSSFLARSSGQNDHEALLLPALWSPDTKWLTLMKYPKPGQEVYLLETETNEMTLLPFTDPTYGIRVIGWIE